MESNPSCADSLGGKNVLIPNSKSGLTPDNGTFRISESTMAGKIREEAERLSEVSDPENELSDSLKAILKTQEVLKERKSEIIQFSQAILYQNDHPVIFPNTINVIQGQTGSHKSRLSEEIGSTLIAHGFSEKESIGFKRNNFIRVHLCLVDSERNHKDQLPYAIQSILVRAGHDRTDNPSNFDYISLLAVERKKRFSVLKEYLEYLREKTAQHIFIILDVATDCIEDFNKVSDSMLLIDLMNQMINEFDVTFLCIVHENPGSSNKARGHFGTEVINKSSTALQVGFEKDSNGIDTEIIRIKYLKCRSTRRFPAFHVKYDDVGKGLVLADETDVATLKSARQQKANEEDLVDFLEAALGKEPMKNAELLDSLCRDFKVSSKTISDRLKSIIESENQIMNENSQLCTLKKRKEGKEIVFYLQPLCQIPADS